MTAAAIITVPAALTEPGLLIAAAITLLGVLLLGSMVLAVNGFKGRLIPRERTQWLIIAGVVVAIGIMVIDNRVNPYIAPADRLLISTPPEPPINLTITADDCGPSGDGLTDQIILTIEKRSDLQPQVTGCVRIAERQYAVESRQPASPQ